jgi:hypothetical protein
VDAHEVLRELLPRPLIRHGYVPYS